MSLFDCFDVFEDAMFCCLDRFLDLGKLHKGRGRQTSRRKPSRMRTPVFPMKGIQESLMRPGQSFNGPRRCLG